MSSVHKDELKEIIDMLHQKLDEIEELSESFRTYFTGNVDVRTIVYWLLQFGNLRSVKVALTVLKNINFVDSTKLDALCVRAVSESGTDFSQTRLCPLGSTFDSGAHIFYGLLKRLFPEESEQSEKCISLEGLEVALLEQQFSRIVFIDDNITSGTQLTQIFRELLTTNVAEREHVNKPLSPEAQSKFKSLDISICVAIQLSNKANQALDDCISQFGLQNVKLYPGIIDSTNYLEYGNALWKTEEEVKYAKDMIAQCSRSLFKDKNWSELKLNDRMFGYGNLGKLTVFSHNIPKSLLPVFWKYEYISEKPWIPLFPERREWNNYRSDIEKSRDGYIELAVDQVLNKQLKSKLPNIRILLGTNQQEETASELNVTIPTKDSALSQIEVDLRHYRNLKHEFESSPEPTGPNGIRPIMGPHKDYGRYNSEVDDYNNALNKYREEFTKYRTVELQSKMLDIVFQNEGTAPANSIQAIIDIPDGLIFVESWEKIFPDPPKVPDPPQTQLEKIGSSHLISSQTSALWRIEQELKNPVFAETDDGTYFEYNEETRELTIECKKLIQHRNIRISTGYLCPLQDGPSYILKGKLISEELGDLVEFSKKIIFHETEYAPKIKVEENE